MIWLFWAVLWQAAHLAIQNDVIFVGPFDMLGALWQLLPEVSFWQTLLHSFFKISAGFLMAFVLGILLGWASYACSFVKDLLEPPMLLIRSVPVASFVILALIWIGSDGLSVFISFLVVIPMIYTGTLTGLEHTDRELLEMSRVFSFPFSNAFDIYIFRPFTLTFKQLPYGSWDELEIRSCGRGIGIPQASIGEQLYYSKLYLDTAGLFAWTFAIIVISAVFERFFLSLLMRVRH